MHRNNPDDRKICRQFKPRHRVLGLTVTVAVLALLWHLYDSSAPAAVPTAATLRATTLLAVAPAKVAPAPAAALPYLKAEPLITQASMATIEVVVRRNDTLDAIFRRMTLDTADLAAIRNLPGIRQSLDFIKPGDTLKVTHVGGELKALSRRVSESQTLDVARQGSGFTATMITNPVETHVRTASASIDSSLFQAAEAADISDMVALKLAEVFAWDIDFVLDIRDGDRFTAVYEQIYQDGIYLRDGALLAAEFVNDGKVYRAVRFVAASGSTAYYSPAGRPMRKAFLRAPVDFTRVSSVFNSHRLHPILNRIRGHMGTDYAAPAGTPVRAAADGHVSFAGRRGGYGNAMILAHNNGVSTLYGHMARFAAHLRAGTHVRQGEVIGYVGMTGLATGPHLHYEYLVNGVHKNPQTVHLAAAQALPPDALQQFHQDTAPLLAALTPLPATAAVPVAPAATTAATTR